MVSKYKYGKRIWAMPHEEFTKQLDKGRYVRAEHKTLIMFLYWSALRIMEALELRRAQFKVLETMLIVDVGQREKHSKTTPPLEFPRSLPFIDDIVRHLYRVRTGRRVWAYSRSTGYRIVKRVFKKEYPHFFRLNRITNLLATPGITIADVRTFTGLTVASIESYAGFVTAKRIGELHKKSTEVTN